MIVLIGFMGAGKSTVGSILARLSGLPFLDTDALVTAREGRSVRQIFEESGEATFREIEREIVLETLSGRDAVVALGGGSLVDPKVCEAIQRATVVHLRVTFGESMRRVGGDADRPMLDLRDPRTLAEERDATYDLVSDMQVDTDGRSPRDVALDIAVSCFGSEIALNKPRHVAVMTRLSPYEVVVGRGLVEALPDHLPPMDRTERVMVITQRSLERLTTDLIASLQTLGRVSIEFVEEGEDAKSLATAQRLYGELARLDFHREDLIVSFGGGVVSDVAGFVASTYARGCRLVHVPTSLLAQVDAAIGGKTGVNLPEAKNLVGSFYQPDAVVCDIELLSTCPVEEMRSGMAEIVKYGFIADPELLELTQTHAQKILSGDAPVLIDVVARSAAIKAEIVGADERDTHTRALLNYGHTLGHAVEQATGFGEIRHGEAISIGMMGAAYLARAMGYATELLVAKHRIVLDNLGLPTTTTLDFEDLAPALKLDKKYDGGVRFVLLRNIADPILGVQASEGQLKTAIDRLKP